MENRPDKNARRFLLVPALTILLAAGILLSLSLGRFPIPSGDILRRVIGIPFPSPQMEAIFFSVRLPRILLACMVGASLAAAGAASQGVFRNPLASPDILGASSGAAAGATFAILLRLPPFMITVSAFTVSLITIAVVLPLGGRVRERQTVGLILAGVMVSALWNAAVSYMKLASDPGNVLPEITYWLMGSLAKARARDVWFVLPAIVLGMLPLLLLRWRINILTLHDDEARSMGIRVRLVRTVVMLGATLLTAAAVSVSGVIGWVGLLVPHIVRRFTGNDYRLLMPVSMLSGAIFLLGVDNVSRILFATEIPLGILTSLAGAPFFLWMLCRKGNLW